MLGRAFLGVLVVLVWAAAGASARSAAPELRLERTDPVTVRAGHFMRRERVRVVLRVAGQKHTRAVRASARGRFTVAFVGVVHDRCSADLYLRAVGSRGSRASLKRPQTLCPVPD